VDKPKLIYCADGHEQLARIAIETGYLYGTRLPKRGLHFPIYFADQDWKRPARKAYMAALVEHRPAMATVLDWERAEQLAEVLDWAEEAAQYVERVVIIPKVPGGIGKLPRRIGDRGVILGYSVPSRYGGTPLPLWSFAGWPVHLLGGSPHRQIEYWRYLVNIADVVSVDGNMHNLMATRYCQFWRPGDARYASNRYWPTLREANGGINWAGKLDAPYEAFRRSCVNIREAWDAL